MMVARFVFVVAVGLALPVGANGASGDTSGSKWQFEVVPYVFLAATDGDMTVSDNTVGVDVGLDDVVDLIGDGLSFFGLMGHFEARYERFSLILDLTGALLDTEESVELPIANPRLRATASPRVKQNSLVGEAAGAYRFYEAPLPGGTRPVIVDALVGVRYYYYWTQVKTDFTATIAAPRGSKTKRASPRKTGTAQWADPIIGVRWQVPVHDRVGIMFRGDIGGFGLASDLSWSLVGLLRVWLPGEVFGAEPSLHLGYKALAFDYERGRSGFDLTYHGPLAALALSF